MTTDSTDSLALPSFTGRQSLREQVTQAVRAAMIAGEMRPGVIYSAPALAARLGVSATPVREAMLDLAKERLVEPVRNKGFRVVALSDRELDEITELRTLIEVPTVRGIAESIQQRDVERLRLLVAAVEEAAESGDVIAYIEADQRFHLELLALAGNHRLVDVVAELRSRARLYGLPAMAEVGELSASAREHTTLLDALARHDAAAAAEVMRDHLGHVRGSWAARAERPEQVSDQPA